MEEKEETEVPESDTNNDHEDLDEDDNYEATDKLNRQVIMAYLFVLCI